MTRNELLLRQADLYIYVEHYCDQWDLWDEVISLFEHESEGKILNREEIKELLRYAMIAYEVPV